METILPKYKNQEEKFYGKFDNTKRKYKQQQNEDEQIPSKQIKKQKKRASSPLPNHPIGSVVANLLAKGIYEQYLILFNAFPAPQLPGTADISVPPVAAVVTHKSTHPTESEVKQSSSSHIRRK